MASALHYMHHEASKGYVYICRDLKPDNIGFAADGTLKIFGGYQGSTTKRLARWTYCYCCYAAVLICVRMYMYTEVNFGNRDKRMKRRYDSTSPRPR